ncbi:hypothetical protein COT87_01695 [Candidatus Collierbacteria bacterium CG10_big_fil_rev_8_21_14_0_10_44_9]|uniref:Uncharacterized protein n=1 Tax=Candidatus Collierbacteria bacterium CG10_big_fil_rev_8_21_14_0_10_44_9 TaxID=1974535 RepID=A0A2H0VIV8_9BACT|nr:MAG: hypothetical protein COT87_01695 [Candidatus Collierbacteria bacterium CG10_big_fil_rev_8_21_14_0_10_44_9]
MNKKFFLIAAVVTVFILILVLLISPRRSSTPTPNEAKGEVRRTKLIDLSKEKRNQTMIYVESIEGKLPLYLENFETSVGITTSINIYRVGDDEAEIVRLEIYGLSYLNSDSDEKKNPNVTAYKESYTKAMEMLEGQNIDPKKLIFIYGDKEYVRQTTQIWIDQLKLKP